MAVGGGWRRLVVGDWWLMAIGSGWRLAVGRRWRLAAVGGWQLVAVGGWRLAVDGPLGGMFARRATFLLTIPTSAPDLPSHGEGPQVDHVALHTFPTKHVA